MGISYKKNLKNQYGKPDVTARDVLTVSTSGAPAALSDSALTDVQGLSDLTVTRTARLDGGCAHLASGISAGTTFSLAILHNGAVVASGDAGADAQYVDLPLQKETLEAVDLAAGDTLRMVHTTSSLLGAPSPAAVGRIHLSLLE